MTSRAKTLICIVGPTAVGKTTTAIGVASTYQTEIISADSRQFYREMNIGTAKPDTKERSVIPHHFIDSHSITENYSAGDYEVDRSEEHTSELQSRENLVCRLLLEK